MVGSFISLALLSCDWPKQNLSKNYRRSFSNNFFNNLNQIHFHHTWTRSVIKSTESQVHESTVFTGKFLKNKCIKTSLCFKGTQKEKKIQNRPLVTSKGFNDWN